MTSQVINSNLFSQAKHLDIILYFPIPVHLYKNVLGILLII